MFHNIKSDCLQRSTKEKMSMKFDLLDPIIMLESSSQLNLGPRSALFGQMALPWIAIFLITGKPLQTTEFQVIKVSTSTGFYRGFLIIGPYSIG